MKLAGECMWKHRKTYHICEMAVTTRSLYLLLNETTHLVKDNASVCQFKSHAL